MTTYRSTLGLVLLFVVGLVLYHPINAESYPLCLSCNKTIPLNDLSSGSYMGFSGGLYNGSNVMPDAHYNAGIQLARQIVPLNVNGMQDSSGHYVLLSIGMSNGFGAGASFRGSDLQSLNIKLSTTGFELEAKKKEIAQLGKVLQSVNTHRRP